MNHHFINNRITWRSVKNHGLHRTAKTLHVETETVLRDIAYVLMLTSRIKDELMQEKPEPTRV